MKKRFLALLLAGLTCLSLSAQNLKEDVFNNDLSSLKKKIKLLETDFSGTSILADYMKSRNNQTNPFDDKMFNYLIELKADVNVKNSDGMAPIHYACSRNQLDAMKKLIKNGADVNVTTKEGKPPVYFAIYNENLKMVKALVEAGCSPTSAWKQQENDSATGNDRYERITRRTYYDLCVTPVFQAIFSRNEEILPYLIKKGFNLSQQMYTGKDAFYLTADYLWQKGLFDSDSGYYSNNVPFHFFANIVTLWKAFPEESKKFPSDFKENVYTKFASNDLTGVKKELLTTDINTLTFLPYALLSGEYSIVNLILKYNDLDVNDPAINGNTLMEWALKNKHMSAVRLLRKHGATLPKDSDYLINAIRNDNLELVKMLIENGTSVNETISFKKDSESPLITMTPLCVAVQENNLSIANYLIQQGADVNKENPLQHSLGKSSLRNLLVKNGAKTDFTFTHSFYNCYVYYSEIDSDHLYRKTINMAYLACLNGNSTELKYYLDSGIKAKENESESSLLFACIFGMSPECLNLLLQKEPAMNQNIQNNVYFYGSSESLKNAVGLLEALFNASRNEKNKNIYRKMVKTLEKYNQK